MRGRSAAIDAPSIDAPLIDAPADAAARRWLAISLPWWASDLARRRLARQHLAQVAVAGAETRSDRQAGSRLAAPRETPLLIHREHRNAKVVAALCPHAHTAGARPGMSLAEAKALCGEHAIEIEWTPEADARALRRLARWCTRYAPHVMPCAGDIDAHRASRAPETRASRDRAALLTASFTTSWIMADVTGCQQVHGGDATLAARVLRDLHRRGVRAQVAIASTQRAALAASAAWPCRVLGPDPREAIDALVDLPLQVLRLSEESLQALREVNVRRIGEALRLPRAGAADRFGPELFAAIDELRGDRPEHFKPLPHARSIEVDLPFDGATTRFEAIELAVTTALDRLCAALARRGRGVRLLEVVLRRVNGLPAVERVPLGRPSRHAKHLWTLLRPRTERVHMGFGVEGIVLRSLIDAPLAIEQRHWRSRTEGEDDAESERHVTEMLDQVTARLGSESVRRAMETRAKSDGISDDRALVGGAAAGSLFSTALRPTVIFPKAMAAEVIAEDSQTMAPGAVPRSRRPVEVRWPGGGGRVSEVDGPERHSPRWWSREIREGTVAADRDFWRVRTADGRWLWLLHRHPDRWSVIGAWA